MTTSLEGQVSLSADIQDHNRGLVHLTGQASERIGRTPEVARTLKETPGNRHPIRASTRGGKSFATSCSRKQIWHTKTRSLRRYSPQSLTGP